MDWSRSRTALATLLPSLSRAREALPPGKLLGHGLSKPSLQETSGVPARISAGRPCMPSMLSRPSSNLLTP